MVGRKAVVAMVAVILPHFSGCLDHPSRDVAGAGADQAVYSDPVGLSTAFDVVSRAGGQVTVAALAWFSEGSGETVTVAIHGSGGCRECWGGVGVPGYSFAERELAQGRTLVAIHLPGFGESTALTPITGMEDHAFVLDQVAAALRSGQYQVDGAPARAFAEVVAIGISIGGLLVGAAQGLFGSFNAIVALSYSHGGYSAAYVRCRADGLGCPDDPRSVSWYLPNADPAVIQGSENLSVPRACGQECAGVPTNFFVWSGCTACVGGSALMPADVGPAPDEVTRLITVPVLVIVGSEDFYYDQAQVGAEQEHFPNAPDFTLMRPEMTGHFVQMHNNAAEVQGDIGTWLDEKGFGPAT